MLEGGEPDPRNPLPDVTRDWMLAKRFGWTYQQIQEQPAVWVDWMLRIDVLASEIEAKRAQA